MRASRKFLILVFLFSIFLGAVQAEKQGSRTFIDRIDSCSGACTTSDNMATLSGGSTAVLDSGYSGFCGVATVEESWYIPHSADEMSFDISYNADYWAGEAQIRIDDGGGVSTVYTDNPPGSRSYSRTVSQDMSAYAGQNVDVRYRILDTSREWCDMGDHGHRFTVESSLSISNAVPDVPSNLQPDHNGVSTNPDISAYYSDPDGNYGSLEFYTSGGDYIDSCSTSSGSRCSVSYSSANSDCTRYYYKVRADDGTDTSSFSGTDNFRTGGCNNAPDTPASLTPTGSAVETGTNLEAYYSDPDGDSGTLYFETAAGSSIDSCSTSSNSRCSVNWPQTENHNSNLEFQVYAEDSNGAESSTRSQSFTTNSRPQISNLRPSGRETSSQPMLRADIAQSDSDAVTVTFYLDGEAEGQDIVSGSGEASYLVTGLDSGSQHDFYVVADDGKTSTTSDTQSFTTNHRPTVESLETQPKSEGHSLEFSSVVSDQDGADQISQGTLTVTDGDGNQETYNLNPETTDGTQATFSQVVSYEDNSQWSQVEDLQFDFEVEDDPGLSDSETDSAAFPNHEPVIESVETSSYSDRDAFEASALIRSPDSGSSEIQSCSIIIENSETSFSAGSMEQVNSTHVRCVQEDIGSGQFPGISTDDEISLTVRATDIHGASSTEALAYNMPTGLSYRYSSMVIPSGGVDFLPYQVTNDRNVEARYRTEIRNVNASFTSNGESSREFSVTPGGAEEMSIQVSPEIGFTGTKELEIVTENLDTGVTETQTVDIKVRDASGSTERSVPGIGLVQIILLIMLSSGLFFTRK